MKKLFIFLAALSVSGICHAMFSDAQVAELVGKCDWDTVAYQVGSARIKPAQLSVYTFDQLNKQCTKGCVLLDRLIQYVANIEPDLAVRKLKPVKHAGTDIAELEQNKKEYVRFIHCILTLLKRKLVNSNHVFGKSDPDKKRSHFYLYRRIIYQMNANAKFHKEELARHKEELARLENGYKVQIASMRFQSIIAVCAVGLCCTILARKYYGPHSSDEDDSLEDEQPHDASSDPSVTVD